MPHLLQETESLLLLESGGLILLERDLGLTVGDTGASLVAARLVRDDELREARASEAVESYFFFGADDE